jgi:copper(I)-binding protein
MHALARGGDHVMFMGLNGPMEHGDTVSVTLSFEKAGDIVVDIPIDLERKPMHGEGHGHGHGDHGNMSEPDS